MLKSITAAISYIVLIGILVAVNFIGVWGVLLLGLLMLGSIFTILFEKPMTEDRDINASINILRRATTLGQRGSHAQGENVRPRQEAVLDELRTDKTHPLRDAVIV